ncbi:MAG: CRTAC1 family protein [Planctomycetes bacterium]|nr:CRTAC1 family protein [Planctomycetota bacterium]
MSLSVAMGCHGDESTPAPDVGDHARANCSGCAPAVGDEPAAPARQGDWFEDVTARTGVDFSYRNGREGGQFTILETVGGGAAVFDYDGDGDGDVAVAGGGTISSERAKGRAPVLLRNAGDWHFNDVTAAAGLEAPGDYSHACSVADFNSDGFADLLITAYGRNRLYRNQGDGSFTEVAGEAGLDGESWSTAAAWGDVDRDGLTDVFVAAYLTWNLKHNRPCLTGGVRDVCPPQNYPPAQDRLFRNLGDGRFEEMTEPAGVSDDGRGLGVLAGDFNADGWIDFYVANDTVANDLYWGGPDWQMREGALLAGAAVSEFGSPEGSMGVEFGDVDDDGDGDLFVTNFEMEDNSLYLSESSELFTHATVAAGLTGRARPLVGFGTGLADFDLDGRLDLFVVNGHVYYGGGRTSYEQPALLFRNAGGKRFDDVSERGGPWFAASHPARGVAVGDLDDDGAPDLVVVRQNEPVTFLRNRHTARNWLRVRLIGTASARDAVGAAVTVDFDGREVVRFVTSGAGYLSHFDSRILLPAEGEASVVTVRWPAGLLEEFGPLALRQTHVLVQGRGEALP